MEEKIKITFKDPDALHEQIKDYVDEMVMPTGINNDEWEELKEIRKEKIQDICSKWFKWGEYLGVEIDLETGEAKVLEQTH